MSSCSKCGQSYSRANDCDDSGVCPHCGWYSSKGHYVELKKGVTRLNLDITTEFRSRLEDVRDWLEMDANSSTIRRMIKIFHELIPELKNGGRLFLRRKDGTEAEVVILPASIFKTR